MPDFYRSNIEIPELLLHFAQEYGSDDVTLICESVPLPDRHIRMFEAAGNIIMRYDCKLAGEGDAFYDVPEVVIVGRGDYTNGLDRLMRTYCTIALDPEDGIRRILE